MSKKNKKLALKKESLRNLSEADLGQVNGGWYNWEWYILKQPSIITGGTDPVFAKQLYYW